MIVKIYPSLLIIFQVVFSSTAPKVLAFQFSQSLGNLNGGSSVQASEAGEQASDVPGHCLDSVSARKSGGTLDKKGVSPEILNLLKF